MDIIMKTALFKNFIREIKYSWSRFFSIATIVALGVAFFAGIRATSPDMVLTADSYFDSSNLMDIRVLSTWGLENEDIAALKSIEEIKEIEPGYSADLFGSINDDRYLLKAMSLPESINTVELEEGRLPQNDTECVIDSQLLYNNNFQIGDSIVFTGEDEDISTYLATDQFTVVGLVNSSYYLSTERGSSPLGDGSIEGFVMIPSSAFTLEVFTEAYITIEGAADFTSFTKEYDNLVEDTLDHIQETMDFRKTVRFDTIKSDAGNKLTKAKEDFSTGKKEFEDKTKEFLSSKKELEKAKKTLTESETALENGRLESQTKLDEVKLQLDTSQKELDAAKKTLEEGWSQLKTAKSELEKQEAALNDKSENIYNPNFPPRDKLNKEKLALEKSKKELATKESTLEATETQLAEKSVELAQGWKDYEYEKKTVEESLEKQETELQKGKAEIEKNSIKIENAEKKLAEGKQEIEDAKVEILEGEKELMDLEEPTYYVLDRNSLEGYVGYNQDSNRINAIGQVFPALFFLVAALVSLTTMTRMVESDRTQIGTLKALGYSKFQIAEKYIFYALIATVTGSLLGMVLGQKILPPIIIHAYSTMYQHLPETLAPLNLQYSLLSTGLAIFTTLAATILACYKELIAAPSKLMRPIAPKNGKRVFLEYLPFLWRRLNFTHKVTARNLLRYKKRFFMTIFGIGSCMALLLVGFGLQDSIFSIVSEQYDNIFTYDATIMIANKSTPSEQNHISTYMEENTFIENSIQGKMLNLEVSGEENTETSYIFAFEETKELDSFISLHDRVTKEHYTLKNSGVIITEKLASLLNLSEGDTLTINDEEQDRKVVIDHIVENHIYHYVYMTKELYEKLFEENLSNNTILIKYDGNRNQQMVSHFQEELLSFEGVESIVMTDSSRDKAEEMINGMDVIIIVLILSAGALAFVVLYNLNNINITERKRELATIKVLGFYDGEVAAYVYRENILLTLIGSLFGIILGIFLHRFVIHTAELDMIMFGRTIFLKSYFFSFLLTLAFSLCVNLILYFKLKTIDMIESLKSVE